ncbi:Double Clp-N motif protein [Striga hermonthica]|uniref:Double Clp-N motif protein n=1 Tax=Striga hermonthica TaxID=68872 RepID=A0A9N7NRU9_STRHE|nr:Double Clp-N motif protein [Striga hermonthica]
MAAQGLSVLSITPSSSATNRPCVKPSEQIMGFSLSSYFVGTKLRAQPSSFGLITSKRCRSAVATISFSLPTTYWNLVECRWSARSIKSFALAEITANKLNYPKTGTEALLMGILIEGTSLAAKILRENGITFYKVREETLELLGKSGILVIVPENPPLTIQAQMALDWAVEEKLKSGESGEITTAYLVLGMWAQKESAGHKVLAALGFNDEKAKELAKTNKALRLERVRKIVSNDDSYLSGLAWAELVENLKSFAKSISRLSRRCEDLSLRSFDHLFHGFANSGLDPSNLGLSP